MKIIKKRLIVWAVVITLILMVPLVAMQFTDEINWNLFDFVVMGAVLMGFGIAYELVARKSAKTIYRVALGIGLAGAFLLFWVVELLVLSGMKDRMQTCCMELFLLWDLLVQL